LLNKSRLRCRPIGRAKIIPNPAQRTGNCLLEYIIDFGMRLEQCTLFVRMIEQGKEIVLGVVVREREVVVRKREVVVRKREVVIGKRKVVVRKRNVVVEEQEVVAEEREVVAEDREVVVIKRKVIVKEPGVVCQRLFGKLRLLLLFSTLFYKKREVAYGGLILLLCPYWPSLYICVTGLFPS
jgi:hypothetical protein